MSRDCSDTTIGENEMTENVEGHVACTLSTSNTSGEVISRLRQ
jgi:hypothetical protein